MSDTLKYTVWPSFLSAASWLVAYGHSGSVETACAVAGYTAFATFALLWYLVCK